MVPERIELRPTSVMTVANLAYLAQTEHSASVLGGFTPEFRELIQNAEKYSHIPVQIISGLDYLHRSGLNRRGSRGNDGDSEIRRLADATLVDANPTGFREVRNLGDVLNYCTMTRHNREVPVEKYISCFQ